VAIQALITDCAIKPLLKAMLPRASWVDIQRLLLLLNQFLHGRAQFQIVIPSRLILYRRALNLKELAGTPFRDSACPQELNRRTLVDGR
jgi:hypothetical protein